MQSPTPGPTFDLVRIGSLLADSGYEASQAIVALIRATQDEIAPRAIVDEWTALKGSSGRNEQMWAAFDTDTITCMAQGTRYLAAI